MVVADAGTTVTGARTGVCAAVAGIVEKVAADIAGSGCVACCVELVERLGLPTSAGLEKAKYATTAMAMASAPPQANAPNPESVSAW